MALMALSVLAACGLEYPTGEATALRTVTPAPPATGGGAPPQAY